MKRYEFLAVAWLAVMAGSARGEEMLFEDRFDGKLAPGWSWLREAEGGWRIAGDALEIRVVPGLAETVKNALVRPAPDRREGRYAIEVTVSNLTPPIQQYEQGGITWYSGGKPVFKLVKELIDGAIYIIPGKIPLSGNAVRLRLVVSGEDWTAQFRAEGETEFKTAATGKLPPPGEDQASIQCYNGPPAAEHWIRFDDFRITRLVD